MGVLAGYAYRAPIVITGSSAGAQTDYQVVIELVKGSGGNSGNTAYLNNHALNWPYDVRFTRSDGSTLLDFWREESDATDGTWHVEADSIPAYPGTGTIYVYYGKAADSDASSGDNTFLFFDDFPGSSLDAAKWDGSDARATVASSILTIASGATWVKLYGKVSCQANRAARFKAKVTGPWGSAWIGFEPSPCCNNRAGAYKTGVMETDEAGNTLSSSGAWSYGTWYTFDLKMVPGTSTYLYYTSYASLETHVADAGTGAATPMIGAYDGANDVDWIAVRKYVTSEPYATVGAEELPIATGLLIFPKIKRASGSGEYLEAY